MIIKYERSQTALALGGISPEPRKSGLEYIALETTRSYTRRRGVFFSFAELQMLVDTRDALFVASGTPAVLPKRPA